MCYCLKLWVHRATCKCVAAAACVSSLSVGHEPFLMFSLENRSGYTELYSSYKDPLTVILEGRVGQGAVVFILSSLASTKKYLVLAVLSLFCTFTQTQVLTHNCMLYLLSSALTDVTSVICPPKYFFKLFKLNPISELYKHCVYKIYYYY